MRRAAHRLYPPSQWTWLLGQGRIITSAQLSVCLSVCLSVPYPLLKTKPSLAPLQKYSLGGSTVDMPLSNYHRPRHIISPHDVCVLLLLTLCVYISAGDCWYLTAVACIATSRDRSLLGRILPTKQSFQRNYTGKFHPLGLPALNIEHSERITNRRSTLCPTVFSVRCAECGKFLSQVSFSFDFGISESGARLRSMIGYRRRRTGKE